jgi:Tol biopolymer transport system component
LFTEAADIMMLTLGKDRHVRPVVQTPQVEQNGVISPDGRWLAYQGVDSGSAQIFVRPFPNANEARTQVSTSGGARPVWATSGRELFYLALDGTLMSVSVAPGTTWKAQPPVPLLDREILRDVSVSLRTYDVSPDGKRFLVIKDAPGSESSAMSAGIVVVQNWVQELKRLAPAGR